MTTITENTKSKTLNLTGPSDPILDAIVRDRLVGARVRLLLHAPFFGSMATRLTLINADEWCSTAATNGRDFYYNSRFIDMLKDGEVEFLFGHEVLHCCYEHFDRCGDRDPRLFNIANDYCVNRDLIKHNVGTKITTVPCLYDEKYDDFASEQIYDQLLNHNNETIQNLVNKMIDEHMDGDGENGMQDMDTAQRQELRDEIKEAMMSAASTAGPGSGEGNVPQGIQRLIKDLVEPKMNWKELLQQSFESTIKDDFTMMRPSRRGACTDAILPGMSPGEAIDIAVGIDMSGSIMDPAARVFLSEIQYIMNSFTTFKIHLFTFDTEVHNPQEFTSDNLENITDYELFGGGGTNFECIFTYLKDNNIVPERLVLFTDMFPWGSWGDEDYCDTLFVAHGTTTIEAPYGITTYYDDAI